MGVPDGVARTRYRPIGAGTAGLPKRRTDDTERECGPGVREEVFRDIETPLRKRACRLRWETGTGKRYPGVGRLA
ncbi:hypothetical protein Afil01_33730 [Actinorhabdospora filicis]|uniref:Uncharacterized protein n=1 Tax=Actinorhabdospora filicis TaxID=1785913 RepID=A0A9W6SPW2_9ACTN|nr:hypothetical protein Afil01_33730 [Actinorhabdospora filicis]